MKYRIAFKCELPYFTEIETARVTFFDCKQCRAELNFVAEVQSGTLLATVGTQGSICSKTQCFCWFLKQPAGRTEWGGWGWGWGWGAGAYRLCHSSRAGVSCTLRLQPVAVGSGQWGRSQPSAYNVGQQYSTDDKSMFAKREFTVLV